MDLRSMLALVLAGLVLAACAFESASTPAGGFATTLSKEATNDVSPPTNTSRSQEEVVTPSPAPVTTTTDLPAVEEPTETTSISEQGAEMSTRTRQIDGMEMVYVPPGTFQMGSSREQIEAIAILCEQYPDAWNKCQPDQFEREYPAHAMTLGGYWIDRSEVTNAQYDQCVQAGDCRPSRLANDVKYNGMDLPVAGIPWSDAVDYCAWVGARLPSEAEWEYAARGSENLIYPWGNDFICDGGNFLDDSTGCEDGYSGSSPVGSFPEGDRWVGAWDMAGNVWEWVIDEFSAYPGASETEANPRASTDTHILRGGSWGYTPAFVRAAYRYPVPPEADYLAVGFRCAADGLQ
ncbi:MAG: formylglycine-generating enzyme family protein [Anaerolineales bacterium]|nr:formylglycine-generating enzyme family protein [Anaerolineales bacterium]